MNQNSSFTFAVVDCQRYDVMNFAPWFSSFLQHVSGFDDVTKDAPNVTAQLGAQLLQNDSSLLSNGSVLLLQPADLLLQPLVLVLSLLQRSFLKCRKKTVWLVLSNLLQRCRWRGGCCGWLRCGKNAGRRCP